MCTTLWWELDCGWSTWEHEFQHGTADLWRCKHESQLGRTGGFRDRTMAPSPRRMREDGQYGSPCCTGWIQHREGSHDELNIASGENPLQRFREQRGQNIVTYLK